MTINDICLSPLNEMTYFVETAISLLVLFQERRTAICSKRLAFFSVPAKHRNTLRVCHFPLWEG